MVSWPDLGTRVTVRYRRPPGSVPPLTDAVGQLLAVDPVVRVQTKTGAVVEFAPTDVVALRSLTDTPMRTSAIRALEHAAATAWPAAEQTWLDGWLLRCETGADVSANSAVPLDLSAQSNAVPAIVAWYERHAVTARLVIPDRVLRAPAGLVSEHTEQILVRDVPGKDADVSPTGRVGTFARAATTDAPDGTRWVGLSEVRGADGARQECEELLAWGAQCGASRGFLIIGDDDTAAAALAESLDFRSHHRRRYFAARPSDWDTV